MTHTSTESRAGRFRRGIAATVVVLIALCGVFLALDYFQGPKLTTASIDTRRVVAQSGQQLRMFSDQNLSKVAESQVSVNPSVPITVASQGQVLTVSFTDRLHYATKYTVTVHGVRSQYQNVDATFRHSFVTSPATVYYLDRADPTKAGDGLDHIMQAGISGAGSTVVYSARHIQEFVAFPAAFAVVTINDDRTDTLSLVSGAKVEQLALPGPGTVEKLRAVPDAALLGLVFTSAGAVASRQYSSTLMTMDLAAAHTVTPVAGLDGKPLDVLDWVFSTGSTTIIAQGQDQLVLMIDPRDPKNSLPLGQYAALGATSPDGKSVVLADALSYLAYSMADGSITRLPPPNVGGDTTFGGQLQLLGASSRIQQVVRYDQGTGKYDSYIVLVDGKTISTLFGGPAFTGSIDGYSVSPNGQYLAVTTVPNYATSTFDGYFLNPRATTVTTIFVDVATGAVVRSVDGFDITW